MHFGERYSHKKKRLKDPTEEGSGHLLWTSINYLPALLFKTYFNFHSDIHSSPVTQWQVLSHLRQSSIFYSLSEGMAHGNHVTSLTQSMSASDPLMGALERCWLSGRRRKLHSLEVVSTFLFEIRKSALVKSQLTEKKSAKKQLKNLTQDPDEIHLNFFPTMEIFSSLRQYIPLITQVSFSVK